MAHNHLVNGHWQRPHQNIDPNEYYHADLYLNKSTKI